MHPARRLAILILVDALLSVAVVHRVQQHEDAWKVRRLALGVLQASQSRQRAMAQ